jgi:hypothetical protein
LKLRIGDLEPVLGGELDAGPLEQLVAADGESAPFLRARLKSSENALPTGVMDVDRLSAICERRRVAASGPVVVDLPSVEDCP